MRKLLAYAAPAIALLLSASCAEDVLQYADPLVGTADNGHTFPAACVPFGFVQPGPDSGNSGWKYTSGFNIADSTLIGFSQNHLNGTGCSDLGDILLLPFTGDTLLRDNPYVKESLMQRPVTAASISATAFRWNRRQPGVWPFII